MNFVGVTDDTVMNWIIDFYTEEGFIMLEREREEAEKRKKEAEERKKKEAEKKKSTRKKRTTKKTAEKTKKEDTAEKIAPAPLNPDATFDVSVKKEEDGQISLI